MIDRELLPYATVRQAIYLEAVDKHGSMRKAAAALGVAPNAVIQSLATLRKCAAAHGYSPAHDMTHTAPAPFIVKGTSTLYDKDGAQRLQWVKTKLDDAAFESAIREFIEDLTEGAKGLSPLGECPSALTLDADLLALYPMGDPHFGLYAWQDETGADFDLDIAEKLTNAAIDRLVASAPPADTALIVELGDFFHADTSDNRTLRSGNALDVDTRWAKVMQIGLRAMVRTVRRCLEKHGQVFVRIVAGNHDQHSSFALALALDAYFSNNPRVKIDLSPAAFWYFRFGQVLIGASHGDTAKMDKLPGIMAFDRPEDWGQSRYRYFLQGHIHHQEVREFPGCTVEAFRTLAARDAWHSGMGYRAGRDMRCIVMHREYGEVERHTCDIAQLERTEA
jgi:hypothetical protein